MSAKRKSAGVHWVPDYDSLIDTVSESTGLTPMSLSRKDFVKTAVSTGMLAYDLAVGGGFAPGRWCGQYGPEAGGKSTACASSIAQAQKRKIRSFFFDHEGSADPAYWGRIGVELYGSFRDADAQQEAGTEQGFDAGPYLKYYAPDSAESSLTFISRLLQILPDKLMYNDVWYYVMDMAQTDANRQGIPFDKKLAKVTGRIWVPAEDGSAQAMFYIDSIASMKPASLLGEKKKGEWNDESKRPALLASALAKHLPGVTSLMVQKRATIVATNQIRERPGVQFGSPEYGPGGNAVKHAHDNRSAMRPRACPPGWGGGGKVQEETCWDGHGIDRYTFTRLLSEKSKDFSPHRFCWVRWWFEANGRPGPGVDPVFDTYQYLKMTGQVVKHGTKIEIKLPGHESTVDWAGFKALLLDPSNDDALRDACWLQLREGNAFELMFDTDQGDGKTP